MGGQNAENVDLVRPVLILALSLALAACGGGDARQREKAPPLVKAEAATMMTFADRIEAVGTARANEQVTLAAPVTERIVRLNFDDGSFVRAGQVVAVLQQAQQTAELREIQARSREAQQQLARVEQLKNRGFATRADYDSRVAAAAAARAQAQGTRAEIGERVIRAPFSGWVSLRTISVGAIASQGTEIATISDLTVDQARLHRARDDAGGDPPRPHDPGARRRLSRPAVRRRDPHHRSGHRSQYPRRHGARAAAQSGPRACGPA